MTLTTVLVLAESFGEGMDGTRVAAAIGCGLRAEGRVECDLCVLDEHQRTQPLNEHGTRSRDAATLLASLDFDRRMRAARAVVIAHERLDDRTLAGSVAFEAATRARQAGVPAYAVTGHDELDLFEARIVDLQVVIEASTPHTLTAAGRKLAELV